MAACAAVTWGRRALKRLTNAWLVKFVDVYAAGLPAAALPFR